MRKNNTEVIVPKIMLNPLPLPHPVCIAIEIYNRDSDDPIRLDDNICWDILRAVEECNTDIQVRIFFSLFTRHCIYKQSLLYLTIQLLLINSNLLGYK